MNILSKYITSILIRQIFLTLCVLLAIYSVFNFIDQVGDIGKINYDTSKALLYVVMTLPLALQDVLPLIIMIGSMLGIGQLIDSHEWVAMRSSGLSNFRLTRIVLSTGVFMIAIIILLNELLAFDLHRFATNYRLQALGENSLQQSNTWLKDGNKFINIQTNTNQKNTAIVLLVNQHLIDNIAISHDISYRANEIELEQVHYKDIIKDDRQYYQIKQTFKQKYTLSLPLSKQLLDDTHLPPEYLNTWQLWQHINYLSKSNIPYQHYQSAFYYRLVQPFLLFAMAMMGLVFMFNTDRSLNLNRQIFIGVIFGILFHIINRFSVETALIFNNSIVVSIIIPVLFLFLLAITLLYYKIKRL